MPLFQVQVSNFRRHEPWRRVRTVRSLPAAARLLAQVAMSGDDSRLIDVNDPNGRPIARPDGDRVHVWDPATRSTAALPWSAWLAKVGKS